MKKFFAIALAAAVVMLANGGRVEAATCGSTGGTTIGVWNTNVLVAKQFASATNISGYNGLFGNIGTNSVTTGTSSSSSIQTISGNTNTTTIGVSGGGATNTTTVTNTGSFVSICTSASN